MKKIKVKNNWLIKLEPEEELVSSLKNITRQEKIKGGIITGIGAVKEVILGYFDLKEKLYQKKFLKKEFELVNLTGNISYFQNEPVIHLHATLGDKNFSTFCGHLFEAKIAVTGEIFILPINERIKRAKDSLTGLNLWKL